MANNSNCAGIEILFDMFYKLYQDGVFCDVVLRSEEGSSDIHAHRIVLASCSPYFLALFNTNSQQQSRNEFTIPNITDENLRMIVRFAYTRDLPLTMANVTSLMVDADQFNVLELVELCNQYVTRNIDHENCIEIWKFAKDFLFEKLQQVAHNYMMYHFIRITESADQALDLSLEELLGILGLDELNVPNERSLWEFVVRWIDRCPIERKAHICRIMQKLRLGLLDSQYFVEKVKGHPLINRNVRCRKLVIDALKYICDLEVTDSRPEFGRLRIPHDILYAVGGWSGGSASNIVEAYDTRADCWFTVGATNELGPIAYHGCVTLNAKIYIIGGYDGTEYFNNCHAFDTVTMKWSEIAPMHYRRCYVSVAVVDGIIYAMGGYDGHNRQNTAEKYDVDKNQWSFIRPMNVQRSDANSATLNGKVYIVGGFNGHTCVNSAEVYDPVTDEWTPITNMRINRSGVGCAAYRGAIYALGGFNGQTRLRSIERYDVLLQTWSFVPDMYLCRSNFGVAVIDDQLCVIGGYTGVSTTSTVERYSWQTNTWLEAGEMSISRSAVAACVMHDVKNITDYICMDRDELGEEKRHRLAAVQRRIREEEQGTDRARG